MYESIPQGALISLGVRAVIGCLFGAYALCLSARWVAKRESGYWWALGTMAIGCAVYLVLYAVAIVPVRASGSEEEQLLATLGVVSISIVVQVALIAKRHRMHLGLAGAVLFVQFALTLGAAVVLWIVLTVLLLLLGLVVGQG